MQRIDVLRMAELFEGLADDELVRLSKLCQEERYQQGETIFNVGQEGDKLYIVNEGFVEVVVGTPGGTGAARPRTVVNLGTGQLFGEMALVDQGPRSATVRALQDNTILDVVTREDFGDLCTRDTRIGYMVMRNLAADLSFKLRHRNLSEMR